MELSHQLVYPMAVYVFYVAGFFLYVFQRRVRASIKGEFNGIYYKDYSKKAELPREFIILERHMDHQFQLPTVFLVTGLAHMALGSPSEWTVYLAWAFVLSRFVHSFIHLGRNKILVRAGAYALGGLIIVLMWIQLVLFAI